MRRTTIAATGSLTIAMLALTACGGSDATCGEAECAAFVEAAVTAATSAEADQPGIVLTGFENELLSPVVEDVRQGVRPFTDQGIGICRGERTCDEYLGTDVGELPEGKYIVMAELLVPDVGERGTWTIEFATECAINRVSSDGTVSTSNTDSSRSYDVLYAGSERGYRLMPLRTITSPSTGGQRECTYTITAPHPDGDKVYTGSWSTPAG